MHDALTIRDDIGPTLDESADAIASAYFDWLDRKVPLVSARRDRSGARLSSLGLPLLRLAEPREEAREVAFPIEGGLLGLPGGEFVIALENDGRAVMILRAFQPRLPMWLYRMTQLGVHRLVCVRFGAYRARRR